MTSEREQWASAHRRLWLPSASAMTTTMSGDDGSAADRTSTTTTTTTMLSRDASTLSSSSYAADEATARPVRAPRHVAAVSATAHDDDAVAALSRDVLQACSAAPGDKQAAMRDVLQQRLRALVEDARTDATTANWAAAVIALTERLHARDGDSSNTTRQPRRDDEATAVIDEVSARLRGSTRAAEGNATTTTTMLDKLYAVLCDVERCGELAQRTLDRVSRDAAGSGSAPTSLHGMLRAIRRCVAALTEQRAARVADDEDGDDDNKQHNTAVRRCDADDWLQQVAEVVEAYGDVSQPRHVPEVVTRLVQEHERSRRACARLQALLHTYDARVQRRLACYGDVHPPALPDVQHSTLPGDNGDGDDDDNEDYVTWLQAPLEQLQRCVEQCGGGGVDDDATSPSVSTRHGGAVDAQRVQAKWRRILHDACACLQQQQQWPPSASSLSPSRHRAGAPSSSSAARPRGYDDDDDDDDDVAAAAVLRGMLDALPASLRIQYNLRDTYSSSSSTHTRGAGGNAYDAQLCTRLASLVRELAAQHTRATAVVQQVRDLRASLQYAMGMPITNDDDVDYNTHASPRRRSSSSSSHDDRDRHDDALSVTTSTAARAAWQMPLGSDAAETGPRRATAAAATTSNDNKHKHTHDSGDVASAVMALEAVVQRACAELRVSGSADAVTALRREVRDAVDELAQLLPMSLPLSSSSSPSAAAAAAAATASSGTYAATMPAAGAYAARASARVAAPTHSLRDMVALVRSRVVEWLQQQQRQHLLHVQYRVDRARVDEAVRVYGAQLQQLTREMALLRDTTRVSAVAGDDDDDDGTGNLAAMAAIDDTTNNNNDDDDDNDHMRASSSQHVEQCLCSLVERLRMLKVRYARSLQASLASRARIEHLTQANALHHRRQRRVAAAVVRVCDHLGIAYDTDVFAGVLTSQQQQQQQEQQQEQRAVDFMSTLRRYDDNHNKPDADDAAYAMSAPHATAVLELLKQIDERVQARRMAHTHHDDDDDNNNNNKDADDAAAYRAAMALLLHQLAQGGQRVKHALYVLGIDEVEHDDVVEEVLQRHEQQQQQQKQQQQHRDADDDNSSSRTSANDDGAYVERTLATLVEKYMRWSQRLRDTVDDHLYTQQKLVRYVAAVRRYFVTDTSDHNGSGGGGGAAKRDDEATTRTAATTTTHTPTNLLDVDSALVHSMDDILPALDRAMRRGEHQRSSNRSSSSSSKKRRASGSGARRDATAAGAPCDGALTQMHDTTTRLYNMVTALRHVHYLAIPTGVRQRRSGDCQLLFDDDDDDDDGDVSDSDAGDEDTQPRTATTTTRTKRESSGSNDDDDDDAAERRRARAFVALDAQQLHAADAAAAAVSGVSDDADGATTRHAPERFARVAVADAAARAQLPASAVSDDNSDDEDSDDEHDTLSSDVRGALPPTSSSAQQQQQQQALLRAMAHNLDCVYTALRRFSAMYKSAAILIQKDTDATQQLLATMLQRYCDALDVHTRAQHRRSELCDLYTVLHERGTRAKACYFFSRIGGDGVCPWTCALERLRDAFALLLDAHEQQQQQQQQQQEQQQQQQQQQPAHADASLPPLSRDLLARLVDVCVLYVNWCEGDAAAATALAAVKRALPHEIVQQCVRARDVTARDDNNDSSRHTADAAKRVGEARPPKPPPATTAATATATATRETTTTSMQRHDNAVVRFARADAVLRVVTHMFQLAHALVHAGAATAANGDGTAPQQQQQLQQPQQQEGTGSLAEDAHAACERALRAMTDERDRVAAETAVLRTELRRLRRRDSVPDGASATAQQTTTTTVVDNAPATATTAAAVDVLATTTAAEHAIATTLPATTAAVDAPATASTASVAATTTTASSTETPAAVVAPQLPVDSTCGGVQLQEVLQYLKTLNDQLQFAHTLVEERRRQQQQQDDDTAHVAASSAAAAPPPPPAPLLSSSSSSDECFVVSAAPAPSAATSYRYASRVRLRVQQQSQQQQRQLLPWQLRRQRIALTRDDSPLRTYAPPPRRRAAAASRYALPARRAYSGDIDDDDAVMIDDNDDVVAYTPVVRTRRTSLSQQAPQQHRSGSVSSHERFFDDDVGYVGGGVGIVAPARAALQLRTRNDANVHSRHVSDDDDHHHRMLAHAAQHASSATTTTSPMTTTTTSANKLRATRSPSQTRHEQQQQQQQPPSLQQTPPPQQQKHARNASRHGNDYATARGVMKQHRTLSSSSPRTHTRRAPSLASSSPSAAAAVTRAGAPPPHVDAHSVDDVRNAALRRLAQVVGTTKVHALSGTLMT